MILFVVVTCWIGIAAAAAVATTAAGVDDDKDENETLGVSEGGNLTISIHINNKDEDPQVLVTRLKGSSQEAIAQLICHNRVCESEYWISGVSLVSDGENVTLFLMNVSHNQTGRYEVRKLSGTQLENKIYTIIVNQPRLSTISPELLPSVRNRKSFTAGVTSAAVSILLLITAAVIGVVYMKRRKAKCHTITDP
ncbi:uncharacterized protein si:rp71-80o10.4 isoform X2 [Ctenopharyngodon idella]|uniref:uncharacterized protein si:rp71-80o10.4 isoform X2 n=1 Tax=Ctenopharyngodon idella TaxID=7959 RepID=UPI002231DCCE|nr:uncharacterized protein si:rp71-80o10.4 isoform X2 [Ctenopharyngodon idella]